MKLSFCLALVFVISGALLNLFAPQNQSLFLAINSLLPVPHFWIAITTLGDSAVAGCIFYLLFGSRSDLLAKGLVGAVIALIASQGLKQFFAILRPEHNADLDTFYLLTESMAVTNFAMPSGHTMTAFLLGSLLLYYLTLRAITQLLLITLMAAIALSRVALGVHWPADVFVGAGLGIMIALVCASLPIRVNQQWMVLAINGLYFLFPLVLVYKIIA